MRNLKYTKEIVSTEVSYSVDKYCCKEMENALTIVKRNEDVGGYATFRWEDAKLLVDIHEAGYHDDSPTEVTLYKVRFCPFCGKKVGE